MRDINSEALREHVVLVTCQAEMGDPLHLILSVIHKSLVKVRQFGRDLHKHIRLLNLILHTGKRSDGDIRGQGVPGVEVIGLE